MHRHAEALVFLVLGIVVMGVLVALGIVQLDFANQMRIGLALFAVDMVIYFWPKKRQEVNRE
jgi:hypothetical protein